MSISPFLLIDQKFNNHLFFQFVMKLDEISPWVVISNSNERNCTLTSFFPSLKKDEKKQSKTSNQTIQYPINSQKVQKNRNFQTFQLLQKSKTKSKKKQQKSQPNEIQFVQGIMNQNLKEQNKKLNDLLGQNLILKFINKKLNEDINPMYDILDCFVQDKKPSNQNYQNTSQKIIGLNKTFQKSLENLNLSQIQNQIPQINNSKFKKSTKITDDYSFTEKLANQVAKKGFYPSTSRIRKCSLAKNNDVLIQKHNSLRKYQLKNLHQFYC